MEFSDETVLAAWRRSGGKCECTRTLCGHRGRCNRLLVWDMRGKEGLGGWEAHHIDVDGPDSPENCEILCQECHKNTQSYGG